MTPGQRRFLTVVVGSTLLACGLGICIDLVTANVAVEYFSVHHPRLVATDNPWLLALFWGVAASWWFGAVSGLVVATINHRRRDPLQPIRILKWTAIACAVIWLIMMSIVLAIITFANTIPAEKRPASFESDKRLVAVAMAHQFEYVFGGIALVAIGVATWRVRTARAADDASDRSATADSVR